MRYSDLFVGGGIEVPVLDGSSRKYINFDNAASTPALIPVQRSVNAFLEYYSSVHRGTGFKSQLSTNAYEHARQIVMKFVGADAHHHTCIFGKNTTEAINKLARRFPYGEKRNIVVTSAMEHHSNDLPWRQSTQVIHVRLTPDGQLDENDYDELLRRYADHIALVAISGASNVTGFINPIHRLAEKAHKVGARIFVDCAQLAPHRQISMGAPEDPAHLDYVALSAHKLYAPFGTGALIGLKDTFERGDPDLTGGGTVEIVTLEDVVWTGPPDRDEAGSPNTVGAVALATALQQLQRIGMEAVAEHEARLTADALTLLSEVPGLKIYGDANPQNATQRLGVIPFKLEGYSHFLVAAILGYEFGIGVRSGCFCAHPYILQLLGLSPSETDSVRKRMLAGDKSEMPGLVRVSFGLYNSSEEIKVLVDALTAIANSNYRGRYIQNRSSGEYYPSGWQPQFDQYFSTADYLI